MELRRLEVRNLGNMGRREKNGMEKIILSICGSGGKGLRLKGMSESTSV